MRYCAECKGKASKAINLFCFFDFPRSSRFSFCRVIVYCLFRRSIGQPCPSLCRALRHALSRLAALDCLSDFLYLTQPFVSSRGIDQTVAPLLNLLKTLNAESPGKAQARKEIEREIEIKTEIENEEGAEKTTPMKRQKNEEDAQLQAASNANATVSKKSAESDTRGSRANHGQSGLDKFNALFGPPRSKAELLASTEARGTSSFESFDTDLTYVAKMEQVSPLCAPRAAPSLLISSFPFLSLLFPS